MSANLVPGCRILYLQYTNPGGYPPLEHSSRILAEAGWKVVFLGTGARGAGNLEFPAHPNIQVKRWRFVEGGALQKIHYLLFGLWCLGTALIWRPNWIYASDPLICPVALVIQRITGVKLVYHEHDSPDSEDRGEGIGPLGPAPARPGYSLRDEKDFCFRSGTEERGKREDRTSIFQKMVMGARRGVARRAEVCVLPNEGRVEIFKKETDTDRPVKCVWNVPSLEEIVSTRSKPKSNEPLALFYGGTLTPKILPHKLLQSIADHKLTTIHICGYPTYSEKKYYTWLKELASKNKNIILYGPVSRYKMLSKADRCHASICLYSSQEAQLNFRHIVGAANKPFDAMARGLAVVVSDLPHWTELYLEENTRKAGGGRREAGRELGTCLSKGVFRIPNPGKGYGIAINPESRESIRAGLEWMLKNRDMLWEMGERGRQKIQNEWNYEKMFRPVFNKLENE